MNINVFMIGDWVYSSFAKYPCKITHIGAFGDGYIEVGVTDVLGLKDIASLTPVPLTEEFFEKNGIKKVIYNYIEPCVIFESDDKRIHYMMDGRNPRLFSKEELDLLNLI